MSTRVPAALIAALTLLATSGAYPGTAVADERTEARRHFRRGMALIDAGRYQDGIAELQTAYTTLPHPNVLFNLGRAYAEAGDNSQAINYFERYLDSNPTDYEEVERLIAIVRDRQAAETMPPGANAIPGAPPSQGSSGSGGGSTESGGGGDSPADDQRPARDEPVSLVLDESALELRRLADATGSRRLASRANRLRATSQALRRRTAAGDGATAIERDGATTGPVVASREDRDEQLYEAQVVSASRAAESPLDAPSSTTTITAQDIRLSGLTSIAEILRRVAGVEVMTLTSSHSDVSIRGLNQRISNKVLVLVDGRPVTMGFTGQTPWTTLPIALHDIERIEIIRGPASALYGADAFSGIVHIITRPPGSGDTIVSGSLGSDDHLAGAATLSGRSEHLGYRLAGGSARSDHWALEVAPDRADLRPLASAPERAIGNTFFDGQFAYRWRDGSVARAGAALNSAELSTFGLGRLRQVWIPRLLFTQLHSGVESPSGLSVRTFWNSVSADLQQVAAAPSGVPLGAEDIEENIADVEVQFARTVDLGVEQDLIVGSSYRLKSISWAWLDRRHEEGHFAFYLQDTLLLTSFLRAQASARVDVHPLLADPQFSPRASLILKPNESASLRATVGTAFRAPTFTESYLDVTTGTPVRAVVATGVGSTTLRPEHMTSFELGYSQEHDQFLALDASLYLNFVDDQILLSSVVTHRLRDWADGTVAFDDETAAFPVGELGFANEAARFRQLGGEVGAHFYPGDGVDLYANYAYHDTTPVDAGRIDATRARDQRTSRHKVNIGGQWRTTPGIDAAVDLHYVSAQTWVEQVPDVEQGVRFEAFDVSAGALLDARLGYRLFDDQLELAVVGTNLLFAARRQHPMGQPTDTRLMGTVTVRIR